MADNQEITPGTGSMVAADETTYSGDAAKVQVIRLVHVTGAEGSKVVGELVRLEDAAHTSGDPGIPVFGVRKDAAAALAGTDGDYTPAIFDASGRLWVNVGETALPSGAATLAEQEAQSVLLDRIADASEAVVTNLPAPFPHDTRGAGSGNVAAAASSTQLLAANANRIGGAIVNDSTAILYVKLGTAASATSYDYFLAGSVSGVPAQMDLPDGWTGVVYGIWASATGNARVSEREA